MASTSWYLSEERHGPLALLYLLSSRKYAIDGMLVAQAKLERPLAKIRAGAS
ncbi:hypothetical protein SNOG_08271 [Parastagonospora nodorum SN15]|uniref:Uncharacterized protein n=1 Tax=Phaeosphaeria nodorum (strain SN15 / ATCC MYA-4574 / FGSC 10173) TaxID=321614 RepID=Q0UIZ3_PHANO|nr:hypothetical protein SNOG_08271 [Parastagonospora nodorum SN15]EAT84547.1 hypothetical protein SNOG_08271 [Parastagonospora nodorum SN15]